MTCSHAYGSTCVDLLGAAFLQVDDVEVEDLLAVLVVLIFHIPS